MFADYSFRKSQGGQIGYVVDFHPVSPGLTQAQGYLPKKVIKTTFCALTIISLSQSALQKLMMVKYCTSLSS